MRRRHDEPVHIPSELLGPPGPRPVPRTAPRCGARSPFPARRRSRRGTTMPSRRCRARPFGRRRDRTGGGSARCAPRSGSGGAARRTEPRFRRTPHPSLRRCSGSKAIRNVVGPARYGSWRLIRPLSQAPACADSSSCSRFCSATNCWCDRTSFSLSCRMTSSATSGFSPSSLRNISSVIRSATS